MSDELMWGGPGCEVDGCPNPAPDYYVCEKHLDEDIRYWEQVER